MPLAIGYHIHSCDSSSSSSSNSLNSSCFHVIAIVICVKQESPAVAKEDALQPIQLLLQYRPSRSSKVDDFHLI